MAWGRGGASAPIWLWQLTNLQLSLNLGLAFFSETNLRLVVTPHDFSKPQSQVRVLLRESQRTKRINSNINSMKPPLSGVMCKECRILPHYKRSAWQLFCTWFITGNKKHFHTWFFLIRWITVAPVSSPGFCMAVKHEIDLTSWNIKTKSRLCRTQSFSAAYKWPAVEWATAHFLFKHLQVKSCVTNCTHCMKDIPTVCCTASPPFSLC